MVEPDGNGSLAIKVRGLTKVYGPQVVLRNLDLELSWGNFLIVFGPNGSGKTTLIKALSTISRPTEGEVSVAGFDLKRNPAAIRRNIGLVTHQPLLYGDLTALENLRFHGKMFGLTNLEERIEKVADLMGVNSFLGRKASILSHGMQKRLSLARAILHDPPILLLDEPETGLDQEALEMLGQMMGAGERGRRTVVMATHSVERGLALGNRLAILSGGKIAFHEDRANIDEAMFKSTYGRFTGVAS
ncbi:MAG: ABC transporter ATP-binding protein [Chloroflexi bacterium]|nr:ABC transporter ATP-binding protein [Chloroflexota bacterium]